MTNQETHAEASFVRKHPQGNLNHWSVIGWNRHSWDQYHRLRE